MEKSTKREGKKYKSPKEASVSHIMWVKRKIDKRSTTNTHIQGSDIRIVQKKLRKNMTNKITLGCNNMHFSGVLCAPPGLQLKCEIFSPLDS